MGRTLQAGTAALAASLALAAAGAAPAWGAEAALTTPFTTDRPQQSTGAVLHVRYGREEEKPPALTAGAFDLPAGTVLDTTAVPACEATDEEFRARGRDACPPETKVGAGFLVAVTGTGPPGDPVHTDVTVFNGPGELIEVVTFKGTNAFAGLDRLSVDGRTLTAHPPPTPGGPPDGRTTIREVRIELPARVGADGRPYLRTPPSCPPDGQWRGEGRFAFADGSTATVPTAQPCRAAAAPDARPLPATATPPRARLGLRVLTRRLVARRRSRVRVEVTSAVSGCRSGVVVRVGRRRTTTGPRGRGVLRVTVRRPGRVRGRAAKPGCGRSTAQLRVLRRR